jgi:hypothetical protein
MGPSAWSIGVQYVIRHPLAGGGRGGRGGRASEART